MTDITVKTKKAIAPTRSATLAALELKTPQCIIHIKHRITIRQYKYWILLLLEMREQMLAGIRPDEQGFYTVYREKISGMIGYDQNKKELWDDLLALKNETIAFNTLNKDGEKERYGAGFISEWKITNSLIRFKFPSFLEEVMMGFKHPRAIFQMLNWNVFNSFSGKYEAILYKLCKDYIGVGRTPYISVTEFRDYMGMRTGEYTQFKELNKWVITRSVKAINESEISDILVFPELKKEGRNVVGLHFRAEYKKQEKDVVKIPFFEPDEKSPFRLAKAPIAPRTQAEYLETRTGDEIMLCIERANEYGEQQEKAGKPVKYGALYRKAISEGWHEEKARQKEKEAEAATKKVETQQREAEAKRAEAEKSERKKAEMELSIQWFEALPESEKKAIEGEFLAESNPIDIGGFKKRGYTFIGFRFFVNKKWKSTN
jgi:hypothetical protein